ncbi:MAG: succinylglutamate desuccinylase/aspartoacylase family protein [Rhodobacteraceae bacterium]|nr:succinylglutamate desuccinylase/aspartoacylase family protein [Paracoccaceae bacterium]
MPSPSIKNDLPIELVAPDILAYASGNTGIPYIWRFSSKVPGPDVMISAIVHGNEPAGAIALDWLLQRNVRPIAGSLTLAFMNIAAYVAFDADDPNASRWVDEDFNRVWDARFLNSDRHSAELDRARQVRPVLDEIDYLLDIHTMQEKAPPVMLAGTKNKGCELARRVGVPKVIVTDQGHASGTRMRDYARFDDPATDAAAVLIECGQHWEKPSGALAIESALRFLVATGTVGPKLLKDAGIPAQTDPQEHWDVTDAITIQSDKFTFVAKFHGGEVIEKSGTLLGHDGNAEVRTPYDNCMLIMPSARLTKGLTAVRLARHHDQESSTHG